LPYGFDVYSRELVPFDSRLIEGVCSLSFSIEQGSLFPLSFVQQACLAFALVKGLCSLFLVLLVSSFFLIYTILTFDQKKEERALSL
jgi:hypothetical protein